MSDRATIVRDIAVHACGKTEIALRDTMGLVDSDGERFVIACRVAAHAIGAASGCLARMSKTQGESLSDDAAFIQTFEFIRDLIVSPQHHDRARNSG